MLLLTRKDRYALAFAAGAVFVVSAVGWIIIGSAILVADVTLIVAAILTLHVETFRRLHQALTTQVPGQPATSTSTRTRPSLARRLTACAVSAGSRPKSRAIRLGVEYTAPPR